MQISSFLYFVLILHVMFHVLIVTTKRFYYSKIYPIWENKTYFSYTTISIKVIHRCANCNQPLHLELRQTWRYSKDFINAPNTIVRITVFVLVKNNHKNLVSNFDRKMMFSMKSICDTLLL